MSRLLNKKEEVYELKLTTHGKYLLGAGKFKPVYYAFLDDNILYDANYAGISETQNSAQKRIKEETQYLEGLVLFQDLEDYTLQDEIDEIKFKAGDVSPRDEIEATEFYRFDQILGDAYLLGESRVAPSWKVIPFDNPISSSTFMDFKNGNRIPQIFISSSYKVKAINADDFNDLAFNSTDPLDFTLKTTRLKDDKIVYLERSEPLMYIEEVNTQVLSENFDVEVFEFDSHVSSQNNETIFNYLKRKYYADNQPQIVDGIMLSAKKDVNEIDPQNLSTQKVEYYFNISKDKQVNRKKACAAQDEFNKESYYVDIDFNCMKMDSNDINVDIYGNGTSAAGDGDPAPDIYGNDAEVPEICQS